MIQKRITAFDPVSYCHSVKARPWRMRRKPRRHFQIRRPIQIGPSEKARRKRGSQLANDVLTVKLRFEVRSVQIIDARRAEPRQMREQWVGHRSRLQEHFNRLAVDARTCLTR